MLGLARVKVIILKWLILMLSCNLRVIKVKILSIIHNKQYSVNEDMTEMWIVNPRFKRCYQIG